MIVRPLTVCVIAVFLGACADSAVTSRDLGGIVPPQPRTYDVNRLTVRVPGELEVSEANLFYPGADIVWRGEPPGDRHAQVRRIFEDGMRPGAATLDGARDVDVDIEVRRFHSLTERARYSVGGVHSIRFILTVRDAGTGTVIEGPRWVAADLDAFGGERALRADREGETQRVRIVAHLDRVIRQQLGDPLTGAAGG